MKTPSRLVAVISIALAGCSVPPADESTPGEEDHSEQPDHEEGIVRLTAEAVERAGLRWAEVETGRLDARLETTGAVGFDQDTLAHVSPRIAGRVLEAPASLGQAVGAGDLLARLDSIELGQVKAAYLQARAQADLARENHEREQGLYADRITSEQEMLAARAAHRQAGAALKTAEATLRLYGLTSDAIAALAYDDPRASLYELRAPFAGKVVEKHVTLGELVTPASTLFVLADLSRVWVWIDVYERDVASVHLEDEVRVRVDAHPARVFRGLVSYLSDRVDADTRTVRARIDVPNRDEALRPGMFARIEVTDPHRPDGERSGSSILVPEDALQREGRDELVFVVRGENTFERRGVRTGRRSGGRVEVVDGLAVGEQVIVEGAFRLKSEAAKGSLDAGHGH